MKKRYRVKSNVDFQKIIESGKKVVGKSFVLYYDQSRLVTNDRVGISVGRKLGNAVERNRVRRQVREMVHEIFDFHRGIDTVILVRGRYIEQDFQENKKELLKLYERGYNNLVNEPKEGV